MSRCLLAVALLGLLSTARDAQAQTQQSQWTKYNLGALSQNNSASGFTGDRFRQYAYNRSVPIYGFTQVNRGLFTSSLTGRPLQKTAKPFSSAGGGQTVSPWLALSEPFTSTASNYYTHVRPQLDQQKTNQQIAARNQALQRQLQSLAAVAPYSPTGDTRIAPTGHVAAYLNYGGYYQPVVPSKGR